MIQNTSFQLMVKRALIAIAPILPVFIILGALLGLLMNQIGMTSWQSWGNSLLVFAGASQFSMVDMLKSGAAFPSIILLTFILNLRHALMAASMSPWLINLKSPMAYFSVFFITDESWAVSMREIRSGRSRFVFFLIAGITLYFTWTTSTLLGWHFGQLLPKNELFNISINFLSVLFFVAVLGLLYENKAQLLPWLIAAALSVVLYEFITQRWHVLIAGIVAAIIGVYLQNIPTDPEEAKRG